MKKYLILFVMALSISSFAQQNVIKLGIGGISMGDYTLGYERAITPKSALNFNFGYWNLKWGAIPVNMLNDLSTDVSVNNIKSGIHTSLDYRFYVGNYNAPRGFYLSPYLRYWDYKLVMNDEINKVDFDINTKTMGLGIGFQMGYQWIVSEKFSIDWYFFGVGAERLILNGAYVTKDGRSFNYSIIEKDVTDVFKGFKYVEKRLTTEPTEESLKVKLPVWMPGIKTGISIGYAF